MRSILGVVALLSLLLFACPATAQPLDISEEWFDTLTEIWNSAVTAVEEMLGEAVELAKDEPSADCSEEEDELGGAILPQG